MFDAYFVKIFTISHKGLNKLCFNAVLACDCPEW